MLDVKRNDVVIGSFGKAIVTDVADGFLVDPLTEEEYSPVDNLVRIMQYRRGKPVFKYTLRSEISSIVS